MLKFLTVLFSAAEGSIAMVMLVEEVKTREVGIERSDGGNQKRPAAATPAKLLMAQRGFRGGH
jgi:hypothetical protein